MKTVGYRRKREGKTDYKKRLKMLLSSKPRLVVRKSVSSISAQIIEYNEDGDKVVASVKGSDLSKLGWNYNYKNTTSAYLLGLLIGKKAKEKGIKEAVLDIGLNKSIPGSRLFAVLKGAINNGLNIPHSEEILPKEERIMGKHIETYANKLDEDAKKKRFSGYLKKGLNPAEISKVFNEVKKKLIGA